MMGHGMGGFTLEAITVTRGPARLLDAVSASIESGRCSAVVGPSGAGKTTLLRVLNRLEDPTEGRVLLGGTPIGELDAPTLRRRVGLVAQRPVLVTDRVADELRVGRRDLSAEQSSTLLQRVGLRTEFAARRTAELSGGEAQRLCLARALAVEPEVLLLDEPTSALDGLTAAIIADLARDHVARGGTVVLVSHDLTVVRRVAHHVLVLHSGRLIASGPPSQIDYLEAR
jgi:putative ABC transport system ATP-binding protein